MPRVDKNSGGKGAGGYPMGRVGSLNIACPKCDARPGHPCVSLLPHNRHYLRMTHRERREAFQQSDIARSWKAALDKRKPKGKKSEDES